MAVTQKQFVNRWLEEMDRARRHDRTSYWEGDRKSTRLNSSHLGISYAVFCLNMKSLTLRSFQVDYWQTLHSFEHLKNNGLTTNMAAISPRKPHGLAKSRPPTVFFF